LPTTVGHAASDSPVGGRYSCGNDAGHDFELDRASAIWAGEPLRTFAGILPWFLPGLAITTVIALAVAGRVARRLRTESWIAFLLLARRMVATMPLVVTPPDERAQPGNHSSIDDVWLHAEIAHPLERLRATSVAAKSIKEHFAQTKDADIGTLVELLPGRGPLGP
jgi:hypothetical protein